MHGSTIAICIDVDGLLYPGYQAKSTDAITKNPTIAGTADVNYILRFYREAGQAGKPAKVWVEDVQGNNVTIEGAPIALGKVSVVKIDKVLMSGMGWAA